MTTTDPILAEFIKQFGTKDQFKARLNQSALSQILADAEYSAAEQGFRAALSSELVAGWKRDAERYRFWREFYRSQFAMDTSHGGFSFRPSKAPVEPKGVSGMVDVALDTAMQIAAIDAERSKT